MSNSKLIDYLLAISFVILFLICIGVKFHFIKAVPTQQSQENLIVIDAGHGGFDPGKVGVNETILEKDINLNISHILKKQLEKAGYQVIMTRTTDTALYNEGDSNKKVSDMRNRVSIINEATPFLAISIHQNSFTDANSKGAQVFYHSKSEDGKQLATTIQATIKSVIQDDNHREAKSNDTYYMLKKTTCPIVIVECGFLSNPDEANLLTTKEYQEKLAKGICEGIIAYTKNNI